MFKGLPECIGGGGLNIRKRILETIDSNTENVESGQQNKPLSLRLHPTAQIHVQSSAIPGSLGSFYIGSPCDDSQQ